MSKNTLIEWCDDTCNPTSGCDGCELWTPGQGGPCYAGNFHQLRLSNLYDPDFSNVRLIPGRMAKAVRCMDLTGRDRVGKPWLNGRRRKIFVGDLGDIFSAAIPFSYLKQEVIDIALSAHGIRHDLLLLTKQPGRAAKFGAWLAEQGQVWPDNVWIGTSITNRASTGRITHLARVPARHRYLSLEPLVDDPCLRPETIRGVVDWLIIGGESTQGQHQGRPFLVQWARDAIVVARASGAAPFIKQLGSNPIEGNLRLDLNDMHGGEWDQWPVDVRVRELPPE